MLPLAKRENYNILYIYFGLRLSTSQGGQHCFLKLHMNFYIESKVLQNGLRLNASETQIDALADGSTNNVQTISNTSAVTLTPFKTLIGQAWVSSPALVVCMT